MPDTIDVRSLDEEDVGLLKTLEYIRGKDQEKTTTYDQERGTLSLPVGHLA